MDNEKKKRLAALQEAIAWEMRRIDDLTKGVPPECNKWLHEAKDCLLEAHGSLLPLDDIEDEEELDKWFRERQGGALATSSFQVGDVVELNGGGPAMTVVATDIDFGLAPASRGLLECQWFDAEDNEQRKEYFPPAAVRRVKKPKVNTDVIIEEGYSKWFQNHD